MRINFWSSGKDNVICIRGCKFETQMRDFFIDI